MAFLDITPTIHFWPKDDFELKDLPRFRNKRIGSDRGTGVGVVVVVVVGVVVVGVGVGVGGSGGRRGRQICLGAAEKEPIKSCGKILATVFVDAKQNSFMVWMNVSRKLW